MNPSAVTVPVPLLANERHGGTAVMWHAGLEGGLLSAPDRAMSASIADNRASVRRLDTNTP